MNKEANRLSESTIALIKLSRMTVTEIAKKADVLRTNIMNAMAMTRGLPDEKHERLKDVLGLEAGRLKPDVIHYWRVGYDIEPLKIAIANLLENGAEIAGIWNKGYTFFDLDRALERLQYIIYNESVTIVVLRTNFGTLALGAKPIGPESIPKLSWRAGKISAGTMITIPKDLMRQILNAEYQNLDEMREILGQAPAFTWDQVMNLLRSHWSHPKDAYLNIKQWLDS